VRDARRKAGAEIDFLQHTGQGLTVVFDDVPSVGTTALAFFVAAGSRDETPGEWGVAHLLEHLLFKGAGQWHARAIARMMDRMGSDINAFTTRNYTCFHARVLNQEALAAYRLLKTMVTDPWILEADVHREKNVVFEEMRESQDDPDDVLDDLLTQALYQDDSFTHDVLGSPGQLHGIDVARIRAFHQRYYRPDFMVLAISGGARDAVLNEAMQDFAAPVARTALPRRRRAPQVRISRTQRVQDWEQVRMGLAIPAPARYADQYASALVTAAILGGQNDSRLWQRLREDEGLVYTVGTQYTADFDFGDMSTYLAIAPEAVDRAMDALKEEFVRLAEVGPTVEELSQTAMALYTVMVMAQETPDARVMRLGRYGLDQVLPWDLDTVAAQLNAVPEDAVAALAASWTRWSDIASAWVGPAPQSPRWVQWG
jgi:predicted Zn-dependent peptidase